nr:hypothetical membrane protein [uncultured archaeon]CBH39902.1 hypothetical membrane protein [uncultured archaeon]
MHNYLISFTSSLFGYLYRYISRPSSVREKGFARRTFSFPLFSSRGLGLLLFSRFLLSFLLPPLSFK